MKKGHISVYLSLVIMILLSVLLTLIEGARQNALNLRAECVADIGISSGFAEFHRELLRQYDLFYIDTSYGGVEGDIANTEKHMQEYMKLNFTPPNTIKKYFYRDFYGLAVGNIRAKEYSLASDNAGNRLKKQAVSYQKDKIGLGFLNEFQEQVQIVKGNSLDTRDIAEEERSIEANINAIDLPEVEVEPGVWKKPSVNNPADAVNRLRGNGILPLVVENMNEISSAQINPAMYLSSREKKSGVGYLGEEKWEASMEEEIFFGEYLIEKCGKYTQAYEKNYFKYQIEYILYGQNADRENLNESVKRLLTFREVSNAIHLFTDGAKTAQADAMAAGLSIITMAPALQPLIKYSLLFAWSFAESVNDVKILLAGGKVPLLKSSVDWKLSIEQMLLFQNFLSEESKNQKGLSYEMYLRIFLFLMPKEEKTMHFMDIIEMDIRKTQGNSNFCLDSCVDRMRVEIEVNSRFGYFYLLKKEYEYEE